jgi:hypothetical protein
MHKFMSWFFLKTSMSCPNLASFKGDVKAKNDKSREQNVAHEMVPIPDLR